MNKKEYIINTKIQLSISLISRKQTKHSTLPFIQNRPKYIDFLNIGKKQDGANVAANAATDSNVPDMLIDTPKEQKDDLPF